MNDRASFIIGRALPIGVFGFLVAIQAELAFAGVQNAFQGGLDRTQVMYLLNRILTVAFFSFLVVIYAIRSKAIAKDHNPVAIASALIGSLHAVVFAVFLGAQLARTYFEERVLRSTYPQYEAYARRTRRLIPFVL